MQTRAGPSSVEGGVGWICSGHESRSTFSDAPGDLGSIPGLGRSPGEGNGSPLQDSGLEDSMDYMYSPLGHKESDTTE